MAHSSRARVALMTAALMAAAPLAAQEAQGPPDGFLPPAPTRPAQQPAQGPDNGGIAPIANPQPRAPTPQPAPEIAAPTQPAAQRTALPPAAARPRPAAAASPRADSSTALLPAAAVPIGAIDNALPPPPSPAPSAEIPADADDGDALSPEATVAPALPDWLPTWWPWALALVAALLALLWWLRRDRSAPAQADGETETAPPPPPPPPAPTPAPLPRAAAPGPKAAPERAAAPAAAPAPPAPIAPVLAAGRAKLVMTLQVDAIDLLADSARISFSLLLANQGDRAATGGLVRIALQQANRRQAELLERFFDGAGGSVLAEDVEIAPGDVGTIQRHALLALDQVEPMLVAGYPSLIPVIGFDITYHWEGEGEAFGQVASAFVLGSKGTADGRIAPVRLDLPPRRLTAPSARVTEMHRVL